MASSRLGAILLSCAVLSAGCGGAPASAERPEVAETAAAETTCEERVTRYREVLATAPASCASDEDCAVYGGMDPDDVCGGATDATTARSLRAIADEATAAGCPRPGYSCPAIEPSCTAGRCR